MLRNLFVVRFAAACLTVLAVSAQAHWPDTNANKWVQMPDATTNGIDVLMAQPAAGAPALILADDFLCRQTGPISDIHLWTSWLNDTNNCNLPITISIWSDVAAITNVVPPIPSHPGSRLWVQTFVPGQYTVQPWKTANELFWNPDPFPCGKILGVDHLIWQYNFYPPAANTFVQQGTPSNPVVYWLAVSAGANVQNFGWKTAANHWNDDAVFAHATPDGSLNLDAWQELRDPKDAACHGRSLDLAFALTTPQVVTNPPPATNKWVQYPDQFNGLDVNDTFPNILADDFLCTAAGTLTNIQIWGSWRDNAPPDPGLKVVLGIWSDVPGGTTSSGVTTYSHPGALLWSETFLPGTYGYGFYGTGNEQFYDPNTGQLTPENQIWLYNFFPKRPFCQKGSTNRPIVYWLSVSARGTNSTGNNLLFGWKTSTNHWNDDAVYGHVTATGSALGDWKDLRDPRLPNPVSLDLAFRINNGPPGPDCDNNNNPRVKYVQWPDTTDRGIDVRANSPKILGDDFLCKVPGTINGVTVWGSWLQDRVDTNTTFQLGLWTDVPAPTAGGGFSHPGQLLCTSTFYPPSTIGTSLARYNYRLDASNLVERFMDPDLVPPIIGGDTQIWRYDFYPRLACWRQAGTPSAPRTYWLSLTANPANVDSQFGWKTSTNHWNDDGVWSHTNNFPPGDWKDLHDPSTGKSLDLSFALRSFPIIGVNKDMTNTTTALATGIQIVLMGIHEVTWHYDDSPPWPSFSVAYVAGNTVMTWSGKTVPPGGLTHVGFEIGGTTIDYVSLTWLGAAGPIGKAIQIGHHTWNNGTTLVLDNNMVGAPVMIRSALVEWSAAAVGLDQLIPGVNRNPIASANLTFQPGPLNPGCALRIPVPPAPPGATYMTFLISLGDQQNNGATLDFIQMPLDVGLQPVIHSASAQAGILTIAFPTLLDRSYRIQQAPDLRSSFFDVFTELSGDGNDMSVDIPIVGDQGFYRIVLDPN